MNMQIQKYITKGHKKIEGWYSHDALELMAELNKIQISENIAGSLCEIGVHHGRSFVLLSLLSQHNEICVAIDLFENQNQNIENSGCGDKEILLRNLKKNQCDLNRVKFISKNSLKINSRELLSSSNDNFRFFSLDGGHSAEIVQNDLVLAESVLCNGGIILIDDYFDEKWPGVSEGTMRHLIINKSKLIPFAIFDDKVLFTNNETIKALYIRELQKLVPRFIIKEAKYMGETCLIIFSSRSNLKNYLRKTKIWQTINTSHFGNKVRSVLK